MISMILMLFLDKFNYIEFLKMRRRIIYYKWWNTKNQTEISVQIHKICYTFDTAISLSSWAARVAAVEPSCHIFPSLEGEVPHNTLLTPFFPPPEYTCVIFFTTFFTLLGCSLRECSSKFRLLVSYKNNRLINY